MICPRSIAARPTRLTETIAAACRGGARTPKGLLVGLGILATATVTADSLDLAADELGVIAPALAPGSVTSTGNVASLVQAGLVQQASILQNGAVLEAHILQSGSGHLASIEQTGSDHQAFITQHGSDNAAFIQQHGSGHAALIEQAGSGKQSSVTQYGQGLQVLVRQHP